MGCGCGGKPWQPNTAAPPTPEPALRGSANPGYTWAPKGNGPAPKTT